MPRCIRTSLTRTFLPALLLLCPALAGAQTDYYNTDKGRPLLIEDAYPVERRAFEIQAAPMRLERATGGTYLWSVEPEVAFGIFPRTQLELGVPLLFIDSAGYRRSGISGLTLSALYNVNVETSLPAFGIGASALLPVGPLSLDNPYVSFKGIATRTLPWARLHVNGEYTFGEEPPSSTTAEFEATRWTAGVAIDHTLPLKSLLLGGEVVLQQPLESTEGAILVLGAGTRYQLAPRWAIDAGFGKRLTGDDRAWYVTFGSAYALGLP
jgi:outer membrane putative beta-barrel porin/alpha-amylase